MAAPAGGVPAEIVAEEGPAGHEATMAAVGGLAGGKDAGRRGSEEAAQIRGEDRPVVPEARGDRRHPCRGSLRRSGSVDRHDAGAASRGRSTRAVKPPAENDADRASSGRSMRCPARRAGAAAGRRASSAPTPSARPRRNPPPSIARRAPSRISGSGQAAFHACRGPSRAEERSRNALPDTDSLPAPRPPVTHRQPGTEISLRFKR